MGTIFTIFTLRAVVVLTMIASASVVVVATVSSEQPPFDPFAPYAEILSGQSRATVVKQGFKCRFDLNPSLEEICLSNPETGIFSEIQVTVAPDTGRVRRVVFMPREKTLPIGVLIQLWSKPQMATYVQTVNLRWRDRGVIAIPQPYQNQFSYWLPITYVAFEFSA